ncbi:enoyl-CoA hydratase [Sphingomonas guangdongensis]|uniref:3-hydroxyisobutyryl-CoA hydrolase n=1 Tax=Sphingomonas guangdongensis TaxID=1141890 RepID=A0A285QZU8_9SPHN|nr:enoyl-CoA hydratase/isomerase family protein [Sphingomonas guangdongensis]SOB87425.1 enoyl-CoA hydratase [Sphingomonas guangdongensis]
MTDEVLIEVEGKIGRIRLNRPRALHALTMDMCRAMLAAVQAWREETSVETIIIDHAEGRGFCAGGDIRAIADSARGDARHARDFFRVEYQLNHALFTCAKPIVAVMDGIVMGGGVGISAPARFRVATENTRFAMPETGIGLFPDVGGGWYLSRLPGRMGEYLGLTGHRLNGAECVALGLATHYVASDEVPGLRHQLAERPSEIESILDGLATPIGEASVLAHQADIDRLFAGETVEDIMAALAADGSAWAAEQQAVLAAKSPQSLKVSLRVVREGRGRATFEDEMAAEYGVVCHVVQRLDFVEGVRALIVDKDNQPRWDPSTLEAVSEHLIDRIFEPLPASEEWTPA